MADETPSTPPPSETVPAARLAEVVAERNAARKEIEALKATVSKADEWRTGMEKTAAELAAERAARAEERDLYRAGLVDEEAHVVARALYGAMPADTRPKTLGEYLGSLKAEGANVPKALANYLTGEVKPAGTPPVQQPRAPANGGKPPPVGQTITPEALRAAREHFQRTGDMSRMKALHEAGKANRA